MMGRVMRKALVVSGLSAVVLASWVSAQEGPTAQVKATVDRVLQILNDPALKSPAREHERLDMLRKIIYARFDFEEMAKRSLGVHWRNRTPKERDEFVKLYADLLEQSYRTKIESYSDQTVHYLKEKVEGGYAVVETKIFVPKENLDVPIDYKLARHDGQWKVYDVVIESVSLVSNYRSQFNRIIQTSSYAELVKKMRVKQEAEALSPGPTSKR